MLKKVACGIIKTDSDKEVQSIRAEKAIESLEKEFLKEFMEVAKNKGYVTNNMKVISAYKVISMIS